MVYIALGVILFVGALLIYIFASKITLPPQTDAIIEQVMHSELPELVVGQTGYATSHGLRIWYESLLPEGTPSTAPKGAVLLIMSNGASAIEWSPAFMKTLLDAGYQVVRYDHRATGLSDDVKNWSRKHPYLIVDMADDAAAVLDALNLQQVHIIGHSMGGMVAQEVAAQHPARVLSLTLMSTSGFIGDPDLPNLSSSYLINTLVASLPLLRYRIRGGEKNLVKERIAKMVTLSDADDIDIKAIAEVVLYDVRKRRGVSLRGALQHQAAVANAGSRYEKLQTINAPALVIHGTADPLIPFEHGKKLVELLPNARSLWLDGVEHVFPFPDMEKVNAAILDHLNNR